MHLADALNCEELEDLEDHEWLATFGGSRWTFTIISQVTLGFPDPVIYLTYE